MIDIECDYLVIGGGATGMAFSDSLLTNTKTANLRVIVVDKHETPGGQWHDSYEFVRLHQPSKGYGVESKKLEEGAADKDNHRATRSEIIEYYADVQRDLESKHDFEFIGGTSLDLAQLYEGNPSKQDYVITNDTTGISRTIHVRKRLVDARNLEPDLPVSTPPKFSFPADHVSVVPVNEIVSNNISNGDESHEKKKNFVVVGGGKTGMDAVSHLLTAKNVLPENLLWVVPNEAWITAREDIGNCIDLLYTSAKLHDDANGDIGNHKDEKKETETTTATGIGKDFFQRGFIEWEKQGHIYRLDPSVVPTKFKDATLSLDEVNLLKKAVPRMIKRGRVAEITDKGSMVFQDGSTMELPFSVEDTLFLHCSAGAFHFSKSNQTPPPIFEEHRIVIQPIYGTPGFCIIGSMLGKLESMTGVSDEKRNSMARLPKPPAVFEAPPHLGKSGGDVLGEVTEDHPFIKNAQNLRMWIDRPELREWVFENRLFHMAGANPAEVSKRLDYIFRVLQKNGIKA